MSGPKCAKYSFQAELRRKREEENRQKRIQKRVKNNLNKIQMVINEIEKEPQTEKDTLPELRRNSSNVSLK